MKHNLTSAIILATGVCFSTASFSAFEMVKEPVKKVEKPVVKPLAKLLPKKIVKIAKPKRIGLSKTLFNQSELENRYRYLSFKGENPKYLGNSFSSGKNMKLSNASLLFMKPGWSFIKSSIDNPKVSWKKKDYWLTNLNDIARQSGLYFVVDWDKKVVNASKYPQTFVYTLKKGESLSVELERWAELSGWTFMWDLEYDFDIKSDTKFKGSFDQVLLKVIKAYQTNGVMFEVDPQISKYNHTAKIVKLKEHK